jgi:cellobiose phosphorylase
MVLRYFDHAGKAVGSHANAYCQIYLNGQSWAVLSGFASDEHARTAMASVFDKTFTPVRLKISTPSFNGYVPIMAHHHLSTGNQGERRGIFVHPNPWAVIAETLLGNGERSLSILIVLPIQLAQ